MMRSLRRRPARCWYRRQRTVCAACSSCMPRWNRAAKTRRGSICEEPSMSLRSIFLGGAVALAGFAAVTSTAKDYGQWQPLFNGKNLDGWQHVGPGEFVIENGVLKTTGGMGLLWYTREKIGNSVVRIVFRVPDAAKGGNSG